MAAALPASRDQSDPTYVPDEYLRPCGAMHGAGTKIIVPSRQCAACWRATARSLYAASQEHLRRKRVSESVRDGFKAQRDLAIIALEDAGTDLSEAFTAAHDESHVADAEACTDQACRMIRSALDRAKRAIAELHARAATNPALEHAADTPDAAATPECETGVGCCRTRVAS